MYFFEYACTTSFAERANPKNTQVGDFWHRHAYVLLSMYYQVGVFISRSTLPLFKIPRVWIMTIFQAVNFTIYFTVAYYKWMSIYCQIPFMVFVGLMGGSSFVNCYYILLNDKRLNKSQREIAVNLGTLFNDIGIVAASFLALYISNYVILDNDSITIE